MASWLLACTLSTGVSGGDNAAYEHTSPPALRQGLNPYLFRFFAAHGSVTHGARSSNKSCSAKSITSSQV